MRDDPFQVLLDGLRAAGLNDAEIAKEAGVSRDTVWRFRNQVARSPSLESYIRLANTYEKATCYPPTLVTTADHDDRVVPWHSFKFTAALQAAQACPNPILIRVETRAGHGAGKPVWMQIEDFADEWAFAAQALQMPVPAM